MIFRHRFEILIIVSISPWLIKREVLKDGKVSKAFC